MPTSIRRSNRNRGKKISSLTRYQHDIYTDPPVIHSRRSKVKKKQTPEVVKKVEKDPLIDSEDDGTDGPTQSKHPSKNYTREDLYDRWVKARTNASKYREAVTGLQKEAVKDQKELEKVYGELNKEREKVDDMQEKIDSLKLEKKDVGAKSKNAKGKKPPVSDTERISNMRATYQCLKEKNDYEHKSVLCELQYKYDELALNLKAKEEEIVRLKDEVRFYKKDHTNIKDLKVATLKSEIQISSLREKNGMR